MFVTLLFLSSAVVGVGAPRRALEDSHNLANLQCYQLDGYDYVGGDIHSAKAATQGHCCNFCAWNYQCTVAIYWQGTCYLKNKAATRTVPSLGRVAVQPTGGARGSTCEAQADTDYACYGKPNCEVGKVEGSDAQACCALCSANPACVHSVYYPGYKDTCYLKGVGAVPTPSTGRTGLAPSLSLERSWPKTENLEASWPKTCTTETDRDYACSGIAGCEIGTEEASDTLDCCNLCAETPRCHRAVFYSGYKNTCYLKSRDAIPVYAAGRTSLVPGYYRTKDAFSLANEVESKKILSRSA